MKEGALQQTRLSASASHDPVGARRKESRRFSTGEHIHHTVITTGVSLFPPDSERVKMETGSVIMCDSAIIIIPPPHCLLNAE